MSTPPPPPSPPALWSTELPFSLLPPKKRLLWLWRTTSETEATDPVPDAPPPAVLLPQIHATPLAAAGAPATNLPVATPAASEADAVVVLSPAAGQKRFSPLPPLAGDLHKPDAPPPPAADGKPSTPPPCKRGRKVVRKVRKVVKKIVPKAKTSFAAAPKETVAAAETAASATGAAGALSHLQTVAVADEEPEPGEFIPDKTAADCNNADAACQPLLLGEQEEATGEEADVAAGEHEVEKKLVSSKQGEERAETARQNRMREVFVGGLRPDAKEEDVRAALAEAGEITDVRIVMDARTAKNKGYCFVRYREPAQARKAIEELGRVKICGKPCRIQALEGNGKAKLAQRDPSEDYTQIHYEDMRPLPMGGNSFCMSHNPHARNGSSNAYMDFSSYGAVPHAIGGYSPVYHQGNIVYMPHSNYYGLAEPWDVIPPMRQSGSRRLGQPHGRRH